jgi:hypothetical protein
MTTGMITETLNTEVGIYSPPQAILENAMVAAKALKTVLAGKLKPVMMNGEQYLEFEDWQTVGQFYGYTVKTGEAVECEVAGVKGAKARADLISLKTGQFIGGAEAYCMRDEDHWNTRAKYEWLENENGKRVKTKVGDETVPWFQLASMAQTRAGAKAFRNRLAWVVVLAGYKATPAEELQGMTDNDRGATAAPSPDKTQHWCVKHNTEFYKRGKMKAYAHPVKDDKGTLVEWCNEPADKKAEPKQEPASANKAAETVTVFRVDMDWLKESLKSLHWTTVISEYLKPKFNCLSEKVNGCLLEMTPEQISEFVHEVQNRLDMNEPPDEEVPV